MGFSVDDLRSIYYRKKCRGLHHRADLHYPMIFCSSMIPMIHNFIG